MISFESKALNGYRTKKLEELNKNYWRRANAKTTLSFVAYLGLFVANTIFTARFFGLKFFDSYDPLFSRLLSDCAIGFIVLTIWFVLDNWRSIDNLTGNERLTEMPSWYLGLCLLHVFLGCVAFIPGDFLLIARWSLVVSVILCERRLIRWVEDTKELEQVFQEVDKEVEEAQKHPENYKDRRCQVCKKESLYEVCLECEKEHQLERQRVRSQILRAKQSGVEATLTLPQWLDTLNAFGYRCAYCQTGPYQLMEHYVPITSGGGTTQENCVPACYTCNSKKSNKHPETQRRPAMPARPTPVKRGRK